jgi:hypothetical protein
MRIFVLFLAIPVVFFVGCSSKKQATRATDNITGLTGKYSSLPEKIKNNVIVSYADQPEKWVMLDESGKEIHQIYYTGQWPDQYKEGLIRIVLDNKIGFVNEEGEVVIDPQYTRASSFIDGKSVVQLDENSNNGSFTDGQSPEIHSGDEHWGVIDKKGNIIKPFIYTQSWDSSLKCFIYQYEDEKFILTEDGKIKSVF